MVKYLFIFLTLFTIKCIAQVPIGAWREHLPYNNAINVCAANNKIYAATTQSILYIDKIDNSIQKLSKINGLAETGISVMKKNNFSNNIIIGYANANLDIIKNNKIINLPDIKRKNIVGDKMIYNIYSNNSVSYICCGFGIVVIDELKNETKETYYIGNNGSYVKVTGMDKDNNFYYAATNEGLKKAPINSNALTNYAVWQKVSGNGLSNGTVQDVKYFNNNIVVLKNDSIFTLSVATWSLLYTSANAINNISISNNKLLISETVSAAIGKIVEVNSNGNVNLITPQNAVLTMPKEIIMEDNSYWVADNKNGLLKVENNAITNYTPNAPTDIATGEMFFNNNKLYIAAGAVNNNWQPQLNKNGLFVFSENSWTAINRNAFAALDSLPDIITVVANDNDVYAGSFSGGLCKIKNTNTLQVYKQNSPLQPAIGLTNQYRISGLTLDTDQNLWVANYGSNKNIHVLKPNQTWQSFTIPFFLNDGAVAQILIDDVNQKWIISPKGNGLICYNSGANLDNSNDDKWKLYQTGGNGNLPSNDVNSITKDKDGILWVGTNKGIALIQCVSDVFTGQGCAAVLPIVQQDQFAGYLFQNEVVQCIAVDGANRKWIGTKNGAWLISSGGEKIIYRFSEDNSFLLNNEVKKIAIDPISGEVFFATAKGICSFRSTATEATEQHEKVLIFPNPVPVNFNGTIGIKGLANGSIVKITELNGRLVYQTKALGGQAIWNGLNYKGQKIYSGAYLVLATSEASNDKVVGKIFFISK
jgi:Two component regulator propeller